MQAGAGAPGPPGQAAVHVSSVRRVRSKAKRLAARGWLAEDTPGSFSLAVSRGGGS
ncbi:hypothetical protein GCM10022232_94040 [Streptomyces plumbiresistens]|uniref:MarR family transcriptional regulator n=1 Tax=Streptomyces plumbiresistens TaxID=511811 RepID=A0ABP7U135_9ACTN